MLVYLLVVTLTGLISVPDSSGLHLQSTSVTHSFTLAYRDRIEADLAVQRIQTRWANAVDLAVTAHIYEICVPMPQTFPCAGAPMWIHTAPPAGVGP